MRRLLVGVIATGLLLFIVINLYVLRYGQDYVEQEMEEMGTYQRGLILGASVKKDGTLSPALQQRVDLALSLYEHDRFEKIFVSGNDSEVTYQEVQSIVAYLQTK